MKIRHIKLLSLSLVIAVVLSIFTPVVAYYYGDGGIKIIAMSGTTGTLSIGSSGTAFTIHITPGAPMHSTVNSIFSIVLPTAIAMGGIVGILVLILSRGNFIFALITAAIIIITVLIVNVVLRMM